MMHVFSEIQYYLLMFMNPRMPLAAIALVKVNANEYNVLFSCIGFSYLNDQGTHVLYYI